jgi:hypothetical protein
MAMDTRTGWKRDSTWAVRVINMNVAGLLSEQQKTTLQKLYKNF